MLNLKDTNTQLLLAAVALVAVGGYMYWKKEEEKAVTTATATTTAAATDVPATTASADGLKGLKMKKIVGADGMPKEFFDVKEGNFKGFVVGDSQVKASNF